MKTLIALNGVAGKGMEYSPLADEAALVIAADGGANFLAQLGVTPHIAVGDFDSIDGRLLARYRAAGVELRRYPREKDATDLELALQVAQAHGATEVVLIGALGGRWDMSFANILVMAQSGFARMRICAVDAGLVLKILHPGITHRFLRTNGPLVSLLPLQGDVLGVTLGGFRYPLYEATLPFGSSLGVSNELAAETGESFHQQGIILSMQQHPL